MSSVTNILLMAPSTDQLIVLELFSGLDGSVDPRPMPYEISSHAAGTKGFEIYVWAVAYNYFDRERDREPFIARFLATRWISPDNVVMIVTRQDDDYMKVFRP